MKGKNNMCVLFPALKICSCCIRNTKEKHIKDLEPVIFCILSKLLEVDGKVYLKDFVK